jgi:hypothetical protein
MDSRRVRYLFFLVVLILGAQSLNYHAIRNAHTNSRHAKEGDRAAISTRAMILLTLAGPFVLFALAGLFVFRRSSVALWGLVATASTHALLVLAALLCEYSIALAAIRAAERGSQYMNCAGDPYVILIYLTLPLTAIALAVPAILHLAAAMLRSLRMDTQHQYAK